MARPYTRSFRPALATIYGRLVNKFPALAPVYRWIAHRESYPPFRRKFARRELHDAIKRECGQIRGGVFFEAGANDGISFSNKAYLERYCGWTGILVEALPHKFVECVKNRPGNIVEHCALVPASFSRTYVEIRYTGLSSQCPQLSDLDPESHVANEARYLLGWEKRLFGQVFLAPARTLAEVLAKHGVRHVDFMSLDLEGAEVEALKGMDFEACVVDRLLIETLGESDTVDDLLVKRGFRRSAQFTHRDYFYRRV